MKHMKHMAIGTLLLLGVSGAAAQSLGDYARAARKSKTKAEPSSAKLRFQKSTASWTSGSRASFSAETITMVGTTVQAPMGTCA